MREFASVLRAAAGEAAGKLAEALLAGDDYGAEAYRERLQYLTRVAQRHAVGLSPRPEPETHGQARIDHAWAGEGAG